MFCRPAPSPTVGTLPLGPAGTPDNCKHCLVGCSWTLSKANPIIDGCLRLPDESSVHILLFLDHRSLLSAKLTSKLWNDLSVEHILLKGPSVYQPPVESV